MSNDLYLIIWKALMGHVDKQDGTDVEEITRAFADALGDALSIYYEPTDGELAGFLMKIKNRIKSRVVSNRRNS